MEILKISQSYTCMVVGESCYDFSFHQAERLKDSLYVIMIDQRGVCRSEVISEEPFGLIDLVEDAEELRKALQIEKWSVIGHSFGGYVALLYASAYPSSIQKIIFEGPTFDFALTSRALLQKTGYLLKKHEKEEVAKECFAYSSSYASSEELLEAYIRLSAELEEKEWRFTILRKMKQTIVYIAMKSGKYFQIALKFILID